MSHDPQQIALLKRDLCGVGQRMYQRGLVAGYDGNISTRLSEDQILCTPTRICKGLMTPDDLCIVDMQGTQTQGQRRRSSEVLLHLEILKARPDVMAVVHSHAPYATAFAVAELELPRGITAEAELFLGEIPIAYYETPGTKEFAETVLPYVARTNVCLLSHHGIVTYANSLEDAYCLTEMLESYCQTLILAKQLGPLKRLPQQKIEELSRLSRELGLKPNAKQSDNGN